MGHYLVVGYSRSSWLVVVGFELSIGDLLLGLRVETTHEAVEFVAGEGDGDVLHEELDGLVVDVAEIFFVDELEYL